MYVPTSSFKKNFIEVTEPNFLCTEDVMKGKGGKQKQYKRKDV